MTARAPAPGIDLDALLRRLHLPTVRRLYPELAQRAEGDGLSYRDFLALLMAEEVAHRTQTRIQRCVRRARFPFLKTIDEYDFTFQSAVRLSLLGSFLGPEFVTQGACLVLSGVSGTGKTHLAVAIAYRAIQNGFEARFTTATALIDELSTATRKSRLRHVLPAYTHPHVLVIDEVGPTAPTPPTSSSRWSTTATCIAAPCCSPPTSPCRPGAGSSTTPTSPRPSSTVSSSVVATSTCAAPPTARNTSHLTSLRPLRHHPHHRPEFPENTGQSSWNPQGSSSVPWRRSA
jgi:hypothetical protein